jgi:hypothetical protein
MTVVISLMPARPARAAHRLPTPSARAQTQAQAPAAAPQREAAAPVEWLTDAEGRVYRLEPLPKAQGVKIADDRVRTLWGVQADLAREDDQFFYIKLYKVGPAPAPAAARPARQAATRPAPAEPLPRVSQRLRWTPYGTGLPESGQWREGLVLADVTGDGRPDIVVSPARKTLRAPAIFVNEGTAWHRSAKFEFPARPYDYGDIAVGDFDRDGTLDLVLGVHLRGLIALRGAPDGHFADASTGLPFMTRPDKPVFSSRAIALGDCNGDGRLDILALGEGPRLPTAEKSDYAVATGIGSFVQQADGTWSAKLQTDRPELFGSSIATGDIDGDGRLDLAIAPGVLGETKVVYRGDGDCGWQAEAVDAVRPRSYITAVAAADVNGNKHDAVILGYTDFATEEPFFGVDVLTRATDGRWTRRALARESGRGRIEAIATGDLDGDGSIDIAIVNGEGDVHLFLNDGHGTFTREQQVITSSGHCAGGALAIGDLDHDGLNDLVVSYAQEVSAMAPGVCPTEGGIFAWKTQRRASATKPTTGSPQRRPTSPGTHPEH